VVEEIANDKQNKYSQQSPIETPVWQAAAGTVDSKYDTSGSTMATRQESRKAAKN
jgi:hypothetical protein